MKIGRNYLIVDNRGCQGKKKVPLTARLIGEYEKYYVFQTAHWRTCILKSSIKIGDYTVKEQAV